MKHFETADERYINDLNTRLDFRPKMSPGEVRTLSCTRELTRTRTSSNKRRKQLKNIKKTITFVV